MKITTYKTNKKVQEGPEPSTERRVVDGFFLTIIDGVLIDVEYSNTSADVLTIPDDVRVISKQAFEDVCVKEVILPAGLESIADEAFKNSTLRKIDLTNVKAMGDRVFEFSELREVTYSKHMTYVPEMCFKSSKLAAFEIPKQVTALKTGCFENTNLKTIDLSGIITLDNSIFFNCLMDHVIRCVGNPEDRFKEDALRIMRALRFAAQLEFDLEMKTKIAAFQMSDTLTKVSAERINSEFCKILTQPMGSQVINNYKEIIAVFIPEIRDMFDFEQNNPYHMFNVWDHTIEVLARAALFMDPNNLALTLAAFFHDIGKPHSYQDGPDGIRHFYGHAAKSAEMTDSIMRRMRFNNSIREQVVTLVKYHDADIKPEAKYIKRWLNKLDSESLLKCLFMLKYADISGQAIKGRTERLKVINHLFAVRCDILKQQACFSLKDLAVNGNDLIAAGMKPGKEIGAILNQMLELVLNDECANDKDALFKAVGIE